MTLEAALQENTKAVLALAAQLAGGAVAADKPAKAEKATTAKAEKAAPKVEETEAAKPEGLDYETQVKPRVLAVVKAKGREVVDALLLENFSVKSAKEVKPDQYQTLLDKLAEAEKAEDDVA